MAKQKSKPKNKYASAENMLIPAGLLIGIGIGLMTGQVAGWTLIGLGTGFLAVFIALMVKNK